MQGDSVLFSSESVEWGTPPLIYEWLNKQYPFVLDPCASEKNHKCKRFFTKQDNGLSKDWYVFNGPVYMNPPYNKPEVKCKPHCNKKRCLKRGYHNTEDVPGIGDWMKKAYIEACAGIDVVCLVPNRSDTAWYKEYAMRADVIYNIGGRVHFVDFSKPRPKSTPSTFPSVIICFEGSKWEEWGKPERPKLYYIEIDKKTNQIKVI